MWMNTARRIPTSDQLLLHRQRRVFKQCWQYHTRDIQRCCCLVIEDPMISVVIDTLCRSSAICGNWYMIEYFITQQLRLSSAGTFPVCRMGTEHVAKVQLRTFFCLCSLLQQHPVSWHPKAWGTMVDNGSESIGIFRDCGQPIPTRLRLRLRRCHSRASSHTRIWWCCVLPNLCMRCGSVNPQDSRRHWRHHVNYKLSMHMQYCK
jgi:hypothetical protein